VKRLHEFIEHISEAIVRIQLYTNRMSWETFLASTITQDAVIRNIEVIGEAARNITRHYPDFALGRQQLKLGAATKMRNAVAHGYFSIDFEIVWSTISSDLPPLLEECRKILDQSPPDAEV
jgi:uncharacterized protein with HEPN domain